MHLALRFAQDGIRSERTSHHAEGHVALGDAHYYGIGVAMDRSKAASHYEAVPPEGQTALFDAIARKQAAFSLGYMFQYGIGVPQDFNLAKRCV